MNLPKAPLQIQKHIRSNTTFNSNIYLSTKSLNTDIWGELYLLPNSKYLLILNNSIGIKFKEVYLISLKLINSNYFKRSYFYSVTKEDWKNLNNKEGKNFLPITEHTF